MSRKQQFARSVVKQAAEFALERLELRRLLASCSVSNGEMTVLGDDFAVGNTIVLEYNSGTDELTAKNGGTGITGCVNVQFVTSVRVYGGSSSTATSTGNDSLNAGQLPSSIPATILGLDGDDTLYGGAAGDSLRGGSGSDYIESGNGDNYVYGDDGDDTMSGSLGSDSMWGGDGDDSMSGGNGNDFVYGEGDGDRLWGGSGSDQIYGGDGPDTLHGADGEADTIDGGGDVDVLADKDDLLDTWSNI